LRPPGRRYRNLQRRTHAIDPQALHRTIEADGAKTASPFEKLVLKRLVDSGYRVHPQWPVGSRRIDLVVEGKTRRLAVECDGEHWHTPEQLNSDLERQAILERLGWTFIRIRGSVFFRDPVTAWFRSSLNSMNSRSSRWDQQRRPNPYVKVRHWLNVLDAARKR
jgi:very-short-patch-repair endonuclease